MVDRGLAAAVWCFISDQLALSPADPSPSSGMSSLATSTPSHGADSRPTLSRAISDATSSLSHLSISPGSGTGVPISRNPPRSPGQEKSSSGSAADSPILGPGFPELQSSSSRTTIRGEGGSLEGNGGEASSWYPGGATLSRPLSAPVAPTSLLAPVLSSNSTHDASPLSRTLSAPSTDLLSRSQTTLVSTPRQIRPFSHPNASRPRASTSATGSYPAARYVPNRHPPPQSPIRTSGFKIAASPPSSLQSHLYTSGLLESTLSDLHLVAFSHFYRLHRIVLGQSGYFSSLLAGGFSEERSGPARKDESEVIYVGMDRPLTRSAFEFCLARLYGGGPELVPPPWAKTSQEHPLSEMFERLWMRSLEMKGVRGTGTEDWEQVAAIGVQPATPTFLLSLLAQSTYLEIPSLQAKALQMIHNTLTPWTVGQYLGCVSFSPSRAFATDSLSSQLLPRQRTRPFLLSPRPLHRPIRPRRRRNAIRPPPFARQHLLLHLLQPLLHFGIPIRRPLLRRSRRRTRRRSLRLLAREMGSRDPRDRGMARGGRGGGRTACVAQGVPGPCTAAAEGVVVETWGTPGAVGARRHFERCVLPWGPGGEGEGRVCAVLFCEEGGRAEEEGEECGEGEGEGKGEREGGERAWDKPEYGDERL